jgi:4-alpha-glucanotransferase
MPTTSPFPPGYRASGVLLHVTSLPSPYGVGDVGPEAYAWIDRLRGAGQRWWQSLPLGPTGYGDSPYQALSTFAGNGLLVSPELLTEEGLLREKEIEPQQPSEAARIDYAAVTRRKHRLLDLAWGHFNAGDASSAVREAFEPFCHKQAHWLDDYALFRALKVHYRGADYLQWPRDVAGRNPAALSAARTELSRLIDQVRFAQFLLFRQGAQLVSYARSKGVGLIGDLPFFVSGDSSDVWAHPELFLLDEHRRPRFVGGVPPDAFSADGQLWGNPVYDWEAHRRSGFGWWIDRVRALLVHVDLIRLDHFRGFAAAWHIPADSPTARTGQWVPAPGGELMSALTRDFGGGGGGGKLPFIAEDLGLITPDVISLRDGFHIPGTRVLQFAFDGSADNPHLPRNYTANAVVYTGTHDNNTTRGWFDELPADQRHHLQAYLKRTAIESADAAPALLDCAWTSSAALAIAPLQDLLNLGAEARMNVPGSAQGNWAWRCTREVLAAAEPRFGELAGLTHRTGRFI